MIFAGGRSPVLAAAVAMSLASAVLAALSVAPAQAAAPSVSAMIEQVPGGTSRADIAPMATIGLGGSFGVNGAVQITASLPGQPDVQQVSIFPPTGQSLAVGSFVVAATADATHAGVSRCAAPESGTLDVTELTWGAGNTVVTAFAADYSVSCGTQQLFGQVRYQSSKDFTALVGTLPAFTEGPMLVATSAPLTLVNEGSAAVTVGTPAVPGPDAASFSIGTDTCPASLAVGASCTVTINALPLREGYFELSVVVPDRTPAGSETIALFMIADVNLSGRFRATTDQYRLLDTRTSGKTFDGHNVGGGRIGGGATRTFAVSQGATAQGNGTDDAVVLNITVIAPTVAGYLTVFPDDGPRPTASSINFAAGQTAANLVTVRLDAARRISLFNHAGSVDVAVDIVGYYPDAVSPDAVNGLTYKAIAPYRLYDSRTTGHKVPARAALQWTTAPGVLAIVVNITETDATAPGYVSAWAGPSNPPPLASTLNFQPGHTVSNMTMIRGSFSDTSGGFIEIGNFSTAGIDLVVDVVGYYDDSELGLHLVPQNPTRIVDSRIGLGLAGALGQGATSSVPVTSTHALVHGVVLNVTGLAGVHDTYLTLWAAGGTRPLISNLDPPARSQTAAMVMVGLGTGNAFSIYNNADTTDVVADLAGVFFGPPGAVAGAQAVVRLFAAAPSLVALPAGSDQ